MVIADQIEVPEGMLTAYADGFYTNIDKSKVWGMRYALAWLANNPIVPTDADLMAIREMPKRCPTGYDAFVSVEWQRRMFLKREPGYPEELKPLLWSTTAPDKEDHEHNMCVRKAYELGLKNGGK